VRLKFLSSTHGDPSRTPRRRWRRPRLRAFDKTINDRSRPAHQLCCRTRRAAPNNRIGTNGFLNQRCLLASDLESILRGSNEQTPFATKSAITGKSECPIGEFRSTLMFLMFAVFDDRPSLLNFGLTRQNSLGTVDGISRRFCDLNATRRDN
jgi:hypothetical protein